MSSLINNIRSGFNKFQSLLPIYGMWGTTRKIVRNVILIEITYRFDKDLHVNEEKVIPKIPLEIIPKSGQADLEKWGIQKEILAIRGRYGLEQFKNRLAKGDAYSNGSFVGFMWLEASPAEEAGYRLKDYEAYHFDAFVFEPYRGKAIFPVLQQSIFNYVRTNQPKIRIVIAHASAWNKPSIVAQQRAGLRLMAREVSLVFLGFHRKFRLVTLKKGDIKDIR
jgi:RimJ/RimL family protein N-acetyltransferase